MIAKTHCARMDHGGCGLLVHVEDGRITKVEPDPHSPLNRGTICPKGIAQIERMYHPDRLTVPLKRRGERGGGRWEPISWDDALDLIAHNMEEVKSRDGAKAICFAQGTPKGPELFLMIRLANLLRAPNLTTPGSVCHMPRETASILTCGFFPIPDYDHPPSCVMVWGSNLFQTNEEGIMGSQLKRALDSGARLIVIDPRKTDLAKRADLWLRPRPGTDLALALGMLRAIVDEGLYDGDFVEKWTVGFDALTEHLQRYPLERISEITWIPDDKIREAARLYAQTKPACIQWGNALEHTANSVQCARALLILKAITGNLDAPGGNVHKEVPPIMKTGALVLSNRFPDKKEEILSARFPLAAMMGFVPSQLVTRAILSGNPYPIRMMFIQGGNPLLSYADARETFEALRKLDFLAVSEIFLTPTAQVADLVLPAATNFEFDDIGHLGLPHGFILARPKIVDPPGACWPDSKIINELGKRLGLGPFFWKDMGQCLDEILRPAGLTFEDFKEMGMLKGSWEYKGYEKKGFKTPSGKVEIYSQRLKDWDFDPLPSYREIQEPSEGGLEPSEQYPLILTSAKDAFSFHSAYRNIPSLRRLSPDPTVLIHPEIASQRGIREGDWVSIHTERGSIRQKAAFSTDLDPRVVVGSIGWWFPERKDLELSGWKEANFNVLTSSNPPFDPTIGTTNLRAIPCGISKSSGF
jgi:anaerobic selenocysteine-containing dehydrogenase